MKTVLHYSNENRLLSFPDGYRKRGVVQPLGELEPGIYHLREIREARPDPLPGHHVRAAEPVADLEAFTYTYGWQQIENPPVDPDSLVPEAITPRQMRLALLARGISPAMIEGMLAGNEAAMIEWEYSLEIRRDHPLVKSMAAALGMEDADVKDIFIAAAQI
jgi:hypothetical protein